MYYEEKWIDGVLHYRTSPRDDFRPIENMEAWVSDKFAAFNAQIDRLRELLDATPPAGAGEAVAWMLRWTGVFTEEGKSHFYTDKKAADRMAETVRDSYGCPDVEVTPLYAAPTPLPEAVRELVARWRARANDHELNVQARAATDCCAAELDAATPPEGAAQGREDARDAARMAWLDNADNAAEIGIYGCLGHDLSLRERIDVAMQHDAALATQPTPAGGGA
jgi:hypothetical protein